MHWSVRFVSTGQHVSPVGQARGFDAHATALLELELHPAAPRVVTAAANNAHQQLVVGVMRGMA
jgi:hypothetical protein